MPTKNLQPTIIPTILVKNRAAFARRLRLMKDAVEMVQVDVMDGKFVPNKTWYDASAVAKMKTGLAFELDLMVRDPLSIIIDWMKVKGFRRALVHVECGADIRRLIREARARCIEIGLAISPGTPLKKILTHLDDIDEIQVMGNKPGFAGKPLDPRTVRTVRAIRAKSKTIPIGFDIAVSAKTIPLLVGAGVTRLAAGSAVFKAAYPRTQVARLERIARKQRV